MTIEVNPNKGQEYLSPAVADMIDLFGPAPVLSTENHQAFYNVLDALLRNLSPQDYIGKWQVWTMAEGTWENMRFSRQKVRTVDYSLCKQLVARERREKTKEELRQGQKVSIHKTAEIIATIDGTINDGSADEHDKAKAFLDAAKHYEMLDNMQNKTIARVNHLQHEYEDHSDNLSSRLREKLNQARLDALIEETRPIGSPSTPPEDLPSEPANQSPPPVNR
jgi:hypothetical protein